MSTETAPRFSGIGGHHSHKAGTVEWLTPPELLAALGPFDLDPCAAIAQPWRTATRMLTRLDNGLQQKWGPAERAFVNPPYANGVIGQWMSRLADHGRGTALIFARTETDAFFEAVWQRAHALLFMRGRINFHYGERFVSSTGRVFEVGDRAPGNAGAPTVLCAYGAEDADILAACGVDGQFVPLRFPRSVLLPFFDRSIDDETEVTWRDLTASLFAGREGPVTLKDLYCAVASHPKAQRNPHYQAKLRQQLQQGNYRRVGAGLWEQATC